MANDAQVSIQATILPDEIAKTLTGTMTVAPVDANDKWYYKLTACTTTSTDLITALGLASDVTYTQHGTLPGGNVQDALADLADQFFRQAATPSGNNLQQGDMWYNTSTELLHVYREVSTGVYEWHIIASAGGSSPTSFTMDGGSF